MPKMGHPDSKQTIDVVPEQVALYEAQGWQVKAPPRKTAAKKTAAPKSK